MADEKLTTEQALDIDHMMSQAPDEPEGDAPEEEETPEPEEGEASETDEPEAEGEDSEESEGEEIDKALEEGEKEKLKEALKPPAAKKSAKATVDGKPVDLSLDATFEQKVDGKVEKVALKDLLESYSSRTTNVRRHRELQRKENEVTAKERGVDTLVNTFAAEVEKGNIIPAISMLVERTGRDALLTIRTLREGIIKNAREYLEMSDEDRHKLHLAEEAEYYKNRVKQKDDQVATTQQMAALEKKIDAAIEKYQIPEGREGFKYWFEQTRNHVKQQISEGNLDPKTDVGPDSVGQFYTAVQQARLLNSVVDEVNPKLREDTEAMDRIAKVIKTFNPSQEDLLDVVKEMYGSDAVDSQRAGKRKAPTVLKPTRSSKSGSGRNADDDDPGLDIDRTPNVADWQRHA